MASATAPEISHIFDPVSGEIITHTDGLEELVIGYETKWQALCDDNILITNQEYEARFSLGEFDPQDCEACRVKAREGYLRAYIKAVD